MKTRLNELETRVLAALPPDRAWRRLVPLIAAAVRSHLHLLVTGEPGVGKGQIVRLIRDLRGEPGRRLFVLHLVSASLDRIEDDLKGHVKGAFSGASSERRGLIALAGSNTLYLDEIGELSPQGQLLFLPLLEERIYCRLGCDDELEVKARLVFSTNRDILADVAEGRFRADLASRVTSGLSLLIPPLRDRPADIAHLVVAHARTHQATFSRDVIRAFERHPYPGNVRDLLGAVDRVIAVSGDRAADPALVDDLATVAVPAPAPASRSSFVPAPASEPAMAAGALDRDALADAFLESHAFRLRSANDHLIRRGLVKTDHNKSECARLLRVGYPVVRRVAGATSRPPEFDS